MPAAERAPAPTQPRQTPLMRRAGRPPSPPRRRRRRHAAARGFQPGSDPSGLRAEAQRAAEDPAPLNKLGDVPERMGQVDEAAARFARAVALQPLEATYRINLARTAGKLGEMDRSIDQYREAARLRPKDYEVLTRSGSRFRRRATTRPRLRNSRRRGERIRQPPERSWDWPPASKKLAAWTRRSMSFINPSTCRRIPLRSPGSRRTSRCFRGGALR